VKGSLRGTDTTQGSLERTKTKEKGHNTKCLTKVNPNHRPSVTVSREKKGKGPVRGGAKGKRRRKNIRGQCGSWLANESLIERGRG